MPISENTDSVAQQNTNANNGNKDHNALNPFIMHFIDLAFGKHYFFWASATSLPRVL